MATLPIENYKANIAASVVENTVTLVQGETGSGKTTQVPQYLYKLLPKYRNKFIGVTQPRRVAAMTLAQRVAEEMDSKLGGLVGYRVRFEERLSEKTKIKFVTDGMLLREAIIDPDLSKYGIVVVDEAHERSVASDVLLSLLKDIAKRRKGFRIVVMSATLDVPKFQSYFKEVQQIKNSNIIKVEGRTFAIEILNTKEPQQDHLGCCLRGVIQILLFEPIGDILVFLTGQEEIEEAAQALRETL